MVTDCLQSSTKTTTKITHLIKKMSVSDKKVHYEINCTRCIGVEIILKIH